MILVCESERERERESQSERMSGNENGKGDLHGAFERANCEPLRPTVEVDGREAA